MNPSMSKISSCAVTECSYNTDRQCHTLAITVGDSGCPTCDTFLKHDRKGGISEVSGGVGACKTDSCQFNQGLECNAGSIMVGMHDNHPDCMTYKKVS